MLGHQVDAGDHLGDRMLHLQTAIHLHEVEAAIRIEQEFHRARTHIARGRGPAHRSRTDLLDELRGQSGRGRLLHQLLVPSLQRAVPQAQMHDIAMGVGQNLHLHVPGRLQVPFDVQSPVTEDRGGVGTRLLPRRGEIAGLAHHPHTAPAAARDGLHDHRITDVGRQFSRLVHTLDGIAAAGQQRQTRIGHQGPRGRLIAEPGHDVRGSAHKNEALGLAHLREIRVLREESVSGMNRIRAGGPRRLDDRRNVEVAPLGRTRADLHRFIGHAHREESRSAAECTATVAIPSSAQVRSTRTAISPRLATSTLRIGRVTAAPRTR